MNTLLVTGRSVPMTPEQNATGLVIFLVIVVVFGLIILAAILITRRAQARKRNRARAFRKNPVVRKGAPILIHGPAVAPDLILPTTGEHVAWYALIILSAVSSLSDTVPRVRIAGVPLPDQTVTGASGFRFSVASGDFAVNDGGVPYQVRISSLMRWFSQGLSKVSSMIDGVVTASGVPAKTVEESMGMEASEGALDWAFGFSASLKSETSQTRHGSTRTTMAYSHVDSVRSTIDSRVQNYVHGVNLPAGILTLLGQKGIIPEDRAQITLIELFIPLGKSVYVLGTYDGDNGVIFQDPEVRLSVSYNDPAGP